MKWNKKIFTSIAVSLLVLFCLIVVFIAYTHIRCSAAVRHEPALWKEAVIATDNNWILTWRTVDSLIERASKSDIDEFIRWTPSCGIVEGGDEDVFLFLWVRLADRGKADVTALKNKSHSWASTTEYIINLYSSGDHRFLVDIINSIETPSSSEPYSFAAIRAAGLVPQSHIEETTNVLHQYVDLSKQIFRVNGIYGEEIAEIESLLALRKEPRGHP